MAKSLLNKLGNNAKSVLTAGALGLAGLLPNNSKALDGWSSFQEITFDARDYGGGVVNYSTDSISLLNSMTGQSLPSNINFSLVYYSVFPEYGNAEVPVGGLNGSGNSAFGFFNINTEYWLGMKDGQNANSPPYTYGFWIGAADLNMNGTYEQNEQFSSVNANGFATFDSSATTIQYAGNITGTWSGEAVPEPSTIALGIAGISTLAGAGISRRRRRNSRNSKN